MCHNSLFIWPDEFLFFLLFNTVSLRFCVATCENFCWFFFMVVDKMLETKNRRFTMENLIICIKCNNSFYFSIAQQWLRIFAFCSFESFEFLPHAWVCVSNLLKKRVFGFANYFSLQTQWLCSFVVKNGNESGVVLNYVNYIFKLCVSCHKICKWNEYDSVFK